MRTDAGTCPDCYASVSADATQCPACARPLEAAQPRADISSAPPTQLRCTRCGHACSPSFNACPACGGSLVAPPPPAVSPTAAPRPAPYMPVRPAPKRATPQVVWLLLGILGVTVALGAVGAVYVRQHWVDILAGLAAADDSAKPGHYPKQYTETFVSSCTDAAKAMKDRARTYCQCFIDEAEPTIKYEDFVRHTLTMASTHKTPPELQPILDACVKKAFGTPQNDERVGTQE